MVEGDSTSLLEVEGRDALDMGDMGFIRRHASSPVQDAKLDLGAVVSAGGQELVSSSGWCFTYLQLRSSVQRGPTWTPSRCGETAGLTPWPPERRIFHVVIVDLW